MIKASFRYEKVATSPSFKGSVSKSKTPTEYFLISKSVEYPISCLYLRYKIGIITHYQTKYTYSGILPKYTNDVTIDSIKLTRIVDGYAVQDNKYLSLMRDRKLEILFSK
jgi:hypothetical protein